MKLEWTNQKPNKNGIWLIKRDNDEINRINVLKIRGKNVFETGNYTESCYSLVEMGWDKLLEKSYFVGKE
jgi:hypothetical protein